MKIVIGIYDVNNMKKITLDCDKKNVVINGNEKSLNIVKLNQYIMSLSSLISTWNGNYYNSSIKDNTNYIIELNGRKIYINSNYPNNFNIFISIIDSLEREFYYA